MPGFILINGATYELGHALLHSEESPRSKEVAKVEVESVAYIVCDASGLDSGDYSFAYVARWAEGLDCLLKETGERVITCARSILRRLERVEATVPEATDTLAPVPS